MEREEIARKQELEFEAANKKRREAEEEKILYSTYFLDFSKMNKKIL